MRYSNETEDAMDGYTADAREREWRRDLDSAERVIRRAARAYRQWMDAINTGSPFPKNPEEHNGIVKHMHDAMQELCEYEGTPGTTFRERDWVQVADPTSHRHGQEGAICGVAKALPTCVWVRFDDDRENPYQFHTDNLRHMMHTPQPAPPAQEKP